MFWLRRQFSSYFVSKDCTFTWFFQQFVHKGEVTSPPDPPSVHTPVFYKRTQTERQREEFFFKLWIKDIDVLHKLQLDQSETGYAGNNDVHCTQTEESKSRPEAHSLLKKPPSQTTTQTECSLINQRTHQKNLCAQSGCSHLILFKLLYKRKHEGQKEEKLPDSYFTNTFL